MNPIEKYSLVNYKRIVERSNIAMMLEDLDGNVEFLNERFNEIFGYPERKLDGLPDLSLVHPDDRNAVEKYRNDRLTGKTVEGEFEFRGIHKNGQTIYLRTTAFPWFDSKGEKVGAIIYVWDISKQKSIEEVLIEKEQQIQAIYDDPETFLGILDLDGNLLSVNKSALKFIGKSISDVHGMKFWDTPWWTHSTKLQKKLKSNISKAKKGQLITFQADHIGVKNDKRYVEFALRPIKNKSGDICRLLAEGINNTERIKAEEKLKQSEEKFRSVLENIQLIGVMLDPDANIIFANDYLLKKSGWKRDEIIGKNWFDTFTEKKYSTKIKQRYNDILRGGKISKTHRINKIVTKDGKQLAVKWSSMAHFDVDNNIVSVTSIGADITKQLETESDLQFQSELIKQSYESILTTDTNFKISWANEAFTRLFGYKKDEVIGKTPEFLNAEPLAAEIQESIYESVKSGKLIKTTLINRKKDGSTFICELSIFPIKDEDGNLIAYSGHQLDITKEKEAQKALFKSEERYRDLFENQIEAYAYHEIILDKKGQPIDYRFIDVNDQFLKEINVKDKSDVIGKTVLELLPATEKKWIEIYGEVAITGEPRIFEQYAKGLDKYYKVSTYSPRIGFFATSFIDITEEKKAEIALKESEEKFRSIFESVSEAVLLTDKKSNILYFNESLCNLTGLSKSELIGKNALSLAKKLISLKQLPKIIKSIENSWRRKTTKPYEIEFNDRILKVSVTFDKYNHNIIGILQDVTEEKETEEKLHRYKDHLEELVEKRTTELKRKNEELDNALKVFVGRELTIKNLEKRINELEKDKKDKTTT